MTAPLERLVRHKATLAEPQPLTALMVSMVFFPASPVSPCVSPATYKIQNRGCSSILPQCHSQLHHEAATVTAPPSPPCCLKARKLSFLPNTPSMPLTETAFPEFILTDTKSDGATHHRLLFLCHTLFIFSFSLLQRMRKQHINTTYAVSKAGMRVPSRWAEQDNLEGFVQPIAKPGSISRDQQCQQQNTHLSLIPTPQ